LAVTVLDGAGQAAGHAACAGRPAAGPVSLAFPEHDGDVQFHHRRSTRTGGADGDPLHWWAIDGGHDRSHRIVRLPRGRPDLHRRETRAAAPSAPPPEASLEIDGTPSADAVHLRDRARWVRRLVLPLDATTGRLAQPRHP